MKSTAIKPVSSQKASRVRAQSIAAVAIVVTRAR